MEDLRPSPTGSGKIVSVPLKLLRPNPSNPRKVITEDQIEVCRISMEEIGQRTPIKIRALSQEETINDPLHEYELIGGHIRYEAAKRLKWEELQAIVLNLSADEAFLEGILDNRGADVFWLSMYESIETMTKTFPNITQKQIGDRLEVTQSTVSGALKVLGYLTSQSRELIYQNLINSKGGYVMPEACVRRLIILGTGDITTDQQRVEAGLRTVIQQGLSEKSTIRLVEWVKKGNTPVTFKDESGKNGKDQNKNPKSRWHKDDPNASIWQTLPQNISIHPTEKGYKVTWELKPHEAAVAIYGGMVGLSALWQSGGKGTAQANYKAILDDLLVKATAEEDEQGELPENN